jgi:hypothetical protein
VNDDGYRMVDAAGHEAAHAVVAVLSGMVLDRVSIAPTPEQRGVFDGLCVARHPRPGEDWPMPLAEEASDDVAAAGFAWEVRDGWRHVVRAAALSAGDWHWMPSLGALVAAVRRASVLLAQPGVRDAVLAVAQALVAAPSGEIGRDTVTRIMFEHGLLPVPKLRAVDR